MGGAVVAGAVVGVGRDAARIEGEDRVDGGIG